MKFKLAAAALCAAGIAVPAFAGDAEDVKARLAEAEAAFENCDVEALREFTHPDNFSFNPDGTLVQGGNWDQMQAQCDAGTKYDYTLNVLKVDVRNDVAIVAGTSTGSVTPQDGDAHPIDGHFTVIMVKNGGKWMSLHFHSSANIRQQAGSGQ